MQIQLLLRRVLWRVYNFKRIERIQKFIIILGILFPLCFCPYYYFCCIIHTVGRSNSEINAFVFIAAATTIILGGETS